MGCTSSKGVAKMFDKPEIPTEETFQTNLVGKKKASTYDLMYLKGKLLGEGITGSVFEVTHRVTGKKYAMKCINLDNVDNAQVKELRTEIMLLRQLDHPNIVKLYEVYEDRETHVLKLVMELLTGGPLGMRIFKDEDDIKSAVKQIVSACRYFHSRGVCHRDLKLENIMWSDEGPDACVKIIDFGLGAQFYSEERLVQRQRMLLRRGSIADLFSSDDQVPIPGMDAEDVKLNAMDQKRLSSGKPRGPSSPNVGNRPNSNRNDDSDGSDGVTSKLLYGVSPNGKLTSRTPAQASSLSSLQYTEREIKKSRIFQTACGTAFYLPPEAVVASNKGYNGEKMDMWAVGVTTYALIAKRPPFIGENEIAVFEKIRRCKPDYGVRGFREMSSAALRFVQCCLVANPHVRYSAEEALRSSWLSNASTCPGGYVPDEAFRMSVVASMRKFATYSSLKKSALMIVAHHQSNFQCKKLNSCFHEIDVNNQGFITYAELSSFLGQVASDMEKREICRVYKAIDQDRTSALTYMEFLAASLEAETPVTEEMAMMAFSHLDQDQVGSIMHSSLTQLLGHGFTNEEIAGIIKEVDKTDSGAVSRDEFLKAMVENLRPGRASVDKYEVDSDESFSSEGDESIQYEFSGDNESEGGEFSDKNPKNLTHTLDEIDGFNTPTKTPRSPQTIVESSAIGNEGSAKDLGLTEITEENAVDLDAVKSPKREGNIVT